MPDQKHPPINESWLDSLQDGGYRLTALRRAIVSIIANSPRALDAIESQKNITIVFTHI